MLFYLVFPLWTVAVTLAPKISYGFKAVRELVSLNSFNGVFTMIFDN